MENMFKKNIKYLLDSGRITTKKILQITGHNSKSLVSMWSTGERYITTKDAVKLCEYLGITMSNLVNDDLFKIEQTQDNFESYFNANKHLLTEEDKDMIKFMIEKRKK